MLVKRKMVNLIYLKYQDKRVVRAVNTVKREINRFKNIEDYNPYEAQKDYKKKRKKSIKKMPEFTEEQEEWLNVRFNKYHDTPSQIIKKFKKKSLVLNFQHVKKLYIN